MEFFEWFSVFFCSFFFEDMDWVLLVCSHPVCLYYQDHIMLQSLRLLGNEFPKRPKFSLCIFNGHLIRALAISIVLYVVSLNKLLLCSIKG